VVRLAITLHAAGNSAPRLAVALRAVARSTRLERGCESCHVWSNVVDDVVRYDETWRDECALQAHLQSDHVTQLLEIMEAAPHPPDVEIEFVSDRRGLEYIADARQGADS
jgi:quinol monooxygenase YgiN